MISNPSTLVDTTSIDYPILDSRLSFTNYIARCRAIIEKHRPDLQTPNAKAEIIVNANSPYELHPANPFKSGQKLKYGVLLIHGLSDSPFTLRDLGHHLQANGMLCRSLLLPGHGTQPSDLLNVSFHDWLQAVRYGVETMYEEVEQIFLVGYSTGAALSIHHALQDTHIAGIVLLAPAIKIKMPIDLAVDWYHFLSLFSQNKKWVRKEPEIDYAKYISIAFHPVKQVTELIKVIAEQITKRSVACPIFMAVSGEDETISSQEALNFFISQHHHESESLYYSSNKNAYRDTRITVRTSVYPELHINHFSHIAISFAPNNAHYGQQGDYQKAALIGKECLYGAYNPMEIDYYNMLYKYKLISQKRSLITYNPDFDYLAERITRFILK